MSNEECALMPGPLSHLTIAELQGRGVHDYEAMAELGKRVLEYEFDRMVDVESHKYLQDDYDELSDAKNIVDADNLALQAKIDAAILAIQEADHTLNNIRKDLAAPV